MSERWIIKYVDTKMPLTEHEFWYGLPHDCRGARPNADINITMTPRNLEGILAYLSECGPFDYRWHPSPERLYVQNLFNGERIPAIGLQIIAPRLKDA